ncbi:MAG: ATP-binding protein [Candidatus Pacebacteria bacterium]|nr:ATP-binding protein [Candidatus Paceibacterota bacterium]
MLFGKKTKIQNLQEQLRKLRDDLNDIATYLDDFIAFLPLPICDIGPSGLIVNVNRSFEELTGFDAIEITGEPFSEFFLEKVEINDLLNIASKGNALQERELTLIKKNKEKRLVDVSIAPRRDAQGNLTGFFVGIIDITQFKELQRKMEERIKERTKDLEKSRKALLNILEDTEAARRKAEEEKKKTEAIIMNFVDGILVFNLEKELELINPKAEEFLQVKKEKVLGKSIEALNKITKLKPLIKLLGKEFKEIFREEISPRKNFYLEVTTKFATYQKKKISFLVILHDISREKAIEEMKSQFVSISAHQLRTPLSIIKWSLGMLLAGDVGGLTKEQKEFLEKTYQTNERMIKLVNDLLNVARIEEGRFVYKPKVVEFDQLTKKIFDSLKDLAKKKNLSYELEIKKSKKPKIVKVDVEKITLVIKNLIENAINYTTKEGGRIKVTVERKNNEVLFSVKDTGVGIPKDQQERIFSRFFRGANVVKMETEGTGLGLFISKNIVEAHGGKIWFKSKENKGTTFFFTLPTIV